MIRVTSPGLQTTVQDLGRRGYGDLGVSASGAADSISLRIGNRLVENAEGAAALEMTLKGGAYLFEADALVAVAGSDFGPTLDAQAVAMWSAFVVRAGQTLRVGHTRTGARSYLCVHGGIRVPLLFGSASTHLLSGLGGFEGRALAKGDALSIGRATAEFRTRTVASGALEAVAPRRTLLPGNCAQELLVTRGPQADRFATERFHGGRYRVTEDANRMGVRLEGPAMEDAIGRDMITEGVALGAVQIPASGQPILLSVEQQTAGGYPKIANLISAELAALGQLRPRDEARFIEVSVEAALARLRAQEDLLTRDAWME